MRVNGIQPACAPFNSNLPPVLPFRVQDAKGNDAIVFLHHFPNRALTAGGSMLISALRQTGIFPRTRPTEPIYDDVIRNRQKSGANGNTDFSPANPPGGRATLRNRRRVGRKRLMPV